MKYSLILLCLVICAFNLNGQFFLLKDIAPDGRSGIGLEFSGQVNDANGKLYFAGSTNQSDFTIWETDATKAGTKRTLSSSSIKNSDGLFFSNDKVYVKDFDGGVKLKVFSPPSNISTISFFNGKSFSKVYPMGDQAIIYGTSEKLFTTDGTNAGSVELPDLTGSSFNTLVTSNDTLGLITDLGFTADFEPTIIYNGGKSTAELKEYLAPVADLELVRAAVIIEDLIVMQDVQGGFVKNSIYNVNTGQFQAFEYFGDYIDGFKLGDKVVAVSRQNIFAINPTDFSYESLVDRDIFGFTNVIKTEDKFYFVGQSSNGFVYFESDGTKAGTRALPGSNVSTSSFNPTAIVYEESLYYIKDEGTSVEKKLMSYDLTSNDIVEIGIASESTGGFVIDNTLQVVDGKLILSSYTKANGHELYLYDPLSSTKSIFNDIVFDIKSTLVSNMLEVYTDRALPQVRIVNNIGQTIHSCSMGKGDNLIDINGLVSGTYYISILLPNGVKSFPFIKM